MSSQLVSALLGAVVAFAGTYVLQRARYRRNDLVDVRARLAAVRLVRTDLYGTKRLCDGAIDQGVVVAGTQYPIGAWISYGHLIIGAVNRPAETALVDVYARLGPINGLILARGNQDVKLDGDMGEDTLRNLVDKLSTAIAFLDRLESEWEVRELRLRNPIRSRLPNRVSPAIP
jgi:hypothetical protein